MTYRESVDVLSRYALAQGLLDAQPLLDALDSYMKTKGIITVPPAPIVGIGQMHKLEAMPDVDKVHRHDRHVARAAKAYNATMITNELTLVADCHREGIAAVCPDEFADNDSQAVVGSPLRRENGLIFARLHPGGWVTARADSRCTVMDIEGLGNLYYRNRDTRWIFEMELGVTVNCHFNGPENEQWVVCAQYRLDRRPGHIKLFAGVSGRTDSSRSSDARTLKMPSIWGPHRPAIGHDRRQQNHWNGAIGRLVFGAAWVGKEQWRALLHLSRKGPSVGEGDRLRDALRQQFG